MTEYFIDYSSNIERFSGFAHRYNNYRPTPPIILTKILPIIANIQTPRLLVDLGCGTGLSTRLWIDHVKHIVGIDPSMDMLKEARVQSSTKNVDYLRSVSSHIALPEGCTDIITCSQSLHWMEPSSTYNEVSRILHPGGVFAAYDCDWPPSTSSIQAEEAYISLMNHIQDIEKKGNFSLGLQHWSKYQHLERMQASGCFKYVKEITIHHEELGNAERLIMLALTQGSTITLLKNNITEIDLGIPRFRDLVIRTLGSKLKPWIFSYRVRIGIK